MSQDKSKQQTAQTEAMLPQEHFWRCYSERLELPVSTLGSIVLHILVVGFLLLLPALLWEWSGGAQAYSPPETDVVEIAGGGGLEGLGFGPGDGPAKVDSNNNNIKQENVQPSDSKPKQSDLPTTAGKLEPIEANKLDVVQNAKDDPDLSDPKVFESIQIQADKDAEKARKILAKALGVSNKQLATTGRVRVGGAGSGGGGGGGKGKGFGKWRGSGRGNAINGKKLTKSQRRELRWNINFGGSALEHLRKLRALQITLAIPSPDQRFYRLVDLSGPVPRFVNFNLRTFKDRVKWLNTDPISLKRNAPTLGLRYVPAHLVIFLPKTMEKELSRLELAYKGRAENDIEYTWFDIQMRDGQYVPVVIGQRAKNSGNSS